MMIELVIIAMIVLLVWVVYKVQKSSSSSSTEELIVEEPEISEPPKLKKLLSIEGTSEYIGDAKFLKQFNVTTTLVGDIRQVVGPAKLSDLTPRVKTCLNLVHDEGGSRGVEVVDFLSGGRDISEQEALYFVLVNPPNSKSKIIGFIDKVRPPSVI